MRTSVDGDTAIAALTALVAGLAACGGGGSSDDETSAPTGDDPTTAQGEDWQGVDDGTTLTLWTRAPMEAQANLLVDAYNASHDNQVQLTIVPNDDYVAKVGAAAGSGDLPDLFAADIVYVPNWTQAGLFTDITDRIASLPFADSINMGHVDAGTYDGNQYVLPFVLDLSMMFYNKDLFREAGLDPEQGPTTVEEFKQDALAIQALDKPDIYGTYFGGNCGGCNVFTWFPMIWASGEDVMNADGTESLLDSDAAKQVYATWRELWEAGAVAPASRDETGATWVASFQEGKIGIMPYPATLLATADQTARRRRQRHPGCRRRRLDVHRRRRHRRLEGLRRDRPGLELPRLDDGRRGPGRGPRQERQRRRTHRLSDNQYSSQDPRVVTVNEVAGSEFSRPRSR